MNIAGWLAATARLSPGAPALLRGRDVEADYATFARRAASIAAGLFARGVAPGDRVALFLHNCTEYLECLYGIWWAGAVAIPINAKLHGREAAWICHDAAAKLAFVDRDGELSLTRERADADAGMQLVDVAGAEFAGLRDHAPTAEPVSREIDDLSWLFYTSGTTGRPKGVMLSNGNLIAMSLCYLAESTRCGRLTPCCTPRRCRTAPGSTTSSMCAWGAVTSLRHRAASTRTRC